MPRDCISIDQGTNGGVEIALFANQSPHQSRFIGFIYHVSQVPGHFFISVHGQSCCGHIRPWIMAYMACMAYMSWCDVLSYHLRLPLEQPCGCFLYTSTMPSTAGTFATAFDFVQLSAESRKWPKQTSSLSMQFPPELLELSSFSSTFSPLFFSWYLILKLKKQHRQESVGNCTSEMLLRSPLVLWSMSQLGSSVGACGLP